MSQYSNTQRTQSNKSGKYLAGLEAINNTILILLPATFPFDLQLSSIFTVLLTLSWISAGYYKTLPVVALNKYLVLFCLLFFIPLLSLFFSDNKDFSLLEKRIFLLIYPLLLFSSPIKPETIRKIIYSFAWSCTIVALYALVMTIRNGEVFGTEMTKQHIGITHVYFGWYLTFAITMIGYILVNRKKYDYLTVLFGIQLLFMLFFLFALSAKMSIISLFILTTAICIRFVIRTRRWILGASILVTPVIIFLLTIKNFDVVYYRFYDLFNPENYFVGDNAWNSIGVRMTILKCVSENVALSPLLGSGVGDVQNDLDACYTNLNLTSVVGMNAHNQYLQFIMGSGTIGLLTILTIYYLSGRQAFRSKNRPYQFFLFLFLLCSLTESLLERQHGTMFFSFFNSLLFTQAFRIASSVTRHGTNRLEKS